MRAVRCGCATLVLALALYLFLWPVPLEIGEFQAPDPPSLTGPYQVNERLKSAERIDAGFGPEAVAFDAQGRMVTGVEDGRILRFSADRSAPEVLAQTGGRPLGMKFDAEGNLIVADAEKGLLLLKSDGAVTVLATEAAGAPIVLADDLDIGPDGTVYFSDASVYPLRDKLLTELLDSRPHGRLLAYERGGKTRVLLSGLRFANGVAVSPDGASVLVTETAAYRVTRYWLQGPKQGLSEPFIENLPGFPDNITASPRGGYWLALASPRIPRVERLQRSRFLRQMLLRLPRSWLPAPQPVNYGIVLGLDPDGRVVHNLQDPDGRDAFQVSSAVEYRSMLYLGTLGDSAVKRLPAP